jgi:hypothetical protein
LPSPAHKRPDMLLSSCGHAMAVAACRPHEANRIAGTPLGSCKHQCHSLSALLSVPPP